jgi:hypothetical protein
VRQEQSDRAGPPGLNPSLSFFRNQIGDQHCIDPACFASLAADLRRISAVIEIAEEDDRHIDVLFCMSNAFERIARVTPVRSARSDAR